MTAIEYDNTMEAIYEDLMKGNFECKEIPYRYVNVRE